MSHQTTIIRKRLSWVEKVRKGLLLILGEDTINPTFRIHHTVDPLKFILVIHLRHLLAKGTREPLRLYIRHFGEKANCELPNIRIGNKSVVAEVYIKERVNRATKDQLVPPNRHRRRSN